MPWTARSITFLPFILPWTDSDNGADNFVAWDEREFGPESTSVSQLLKRVWDTRWPEFAPRMQEYHRL